MTTITSLIAQLTTEQVAQAKATMSGLCGIDIRGKKAAAEWEAKGFKLGKVSAQYYCIDWQLAKEVHEFLNRHSNAVKVIRIDGKYDDSMGAFETVTVADENGQEWEIGNMYDQSVCFRMMDHNSILEYVNKQ